MDHTWFKCRNCSTHYCPFCMGGLKLCTVCGAAEGSLTTHCLGSKLTPQQEADVHADRLDYADGQWIRLGYLAKRFSGKSLALTTLGSRTGFYIGTAENGTPFTRESVEFFASEPLAEHALARGDWTQREAP